MKLFNLFAVIITALGLTSCLGSSDNTISQDFTPYCINYVTDMSTGTSYTNTGTSYRLLNNLDNGTLTVEIGNLKLTNGTHVSLTVADQRYTYSEDGAMVLNVPSYVSVVAGMTHTVTNLKMSYYSRYLGQRSYPMLMLDYVVDNLYSVKVIYSPAYYWGKTTVVDQDGKVYINDAQTSFYGVGFDPEKNTANFAAMSAKFAENMPALNMTFKDIPYTFSQSGYTLKKDEIVPTIGDTPYPSYKITDFVMSGYWGGSQTVKFTCTIDTEKMKGSYTVTAYLGILPEKPSGSN